MALPSLYTIASQFRALTEMDVESIDEQTILDTIEGLQGDLQLKCTNVVAFQQNLEAYAAMVDAAARRMAERAHAAQKKADAVKHYLKTAMANNGITKIECPEFVVSIQKNPQSVVIDPFAVVPDDCMTIPPAPLPYPNKTAIKQALKDGRELRGCRLVQTTRLVIK